MAPDEKARTQAETPPTSWQNTPPRAPARHYIIAGAHDIVAADVRHLTKQQLGDLYASLLIYDVTGIDSPPEDPALRLVYELRKDHADIAVAKHDERRGINSSNAKGRGKNKPPAEEPEPKSKPQPLPEQEIDPAPIEYAQEQIDRLREKLGKVTKTL